MSGSVAHEAFAQQVAEFSARARLTADALGSAIDSAAVSSSAPMARATQARHNLYAAIEAEFGMLTSAEAGEHMGSRSAASRNLALAARREGRLLGLSRGRYAVFPGFQFDAEGLRPVIATLIGLGEEFGWTEAGLVQWLMAPTTYLGDRRPVDVLDDEAELIAVARAAFGVEW